MHSSLRNSTIPLKTASICSIRDSWKSEKTGTKTAQRHFSFTYQSSIPGQSTQILTGLILHPSSRHSLWDLRLDRLYVRVIDARRLNCLGIFVSPLECRPSDRACPRNYNHRISHSSILSISPEMKLSSVTLPIEMTYL
jgi:hypothetical protein